MNSDLYMRSLRLSLAVGLAMMAGCDNGVQPDKVAQNAGVDDVVDSDVLTLEDPSGALEDLSGTSEQSARLISKFTTVDNDFDAKWFCSFFNQSEFISRSMLKLEVNGSGSLDAHSIQWDTVDDSELTLSSSSWALQIDQVTFSTSVAANDRFDGAVGEHTSVVCDWSGAHRDGTTLLSDEIETASSSFVEELDPELTGRLITTLNNGTEQKAWSCELSKEGAIVDYLDYEFYPANLGFSVFDFRWYSVGEDEVKIVYGEVDYDLSNFKFLDENYAAFTADDSRGYDLSCSRS